MKNKTGIKIGIWSVSLLTMGVVFIASGLPVIGAHFPDASQTAVQNMMTIPCIVVIFVTIIVGKLMETISKKILTLIGLVVFLIGGIGPMFADSIGLILVFRGILGAGVGTLQCTASALIAENFDGDERASVQGVLQACQMGGMGVMSIVGGVLADKAWNLTFAVHFLAVVSFFAVLFLVPNKKPEKITETGEKHQTHLTPAAWGWVVLMFVSFISIMVYSAYLAYLMTEKNLGNSADSGISLALFALAGVIVGAVYGKFAGALKNKVIACSMIVGMIAYLILAFAPNIIIIHIGSFLTGWSLSMFMPPMFLNAGLSVDAWTAPMAISLVTSAQNLGQFVCPYIMNPLSGMISGGENTTKTVFILGAVLFGVLAVVMMIWGVKKDKSGAA